MKYIYYVYSLNNISLNGDSMRQQSISLWKHCSTWAMTVPLNKGDLFLWSSRKYPRESLLFLFFHKVHVDERMDDHLRVTVKRSQTPRVEHSYSLPRCCRNLQAHTKQLFVQITEYRLHCEHDHHPNIIRNSNDIDFDLSICESLRKQRLLPISEWRKSIQTEGGKWISIWMIESSSGTNSTLVDVFDSIAIGSRKSCNIPLINNIFCYVFRVLEPYSRKLTVDVVVKTPQLVIVQQPPMS